MKNDMNYLFSEWLDKVNMYISCIVGGFYKRESITGDFMTVLSHLKRVKSPF